MLRSHPHAKAAKVSLDGLPLRCVCVEVCCFEQCPNAACACRAMGRTASKEVSSALPVCRANDPR